MPEATLETLLAYLREHGERFSSRYLRDELLEQGYDPALVAEAIAAYDAERGNPPACSGPAVAPSRSASP